MSEESVEDLHRHRRQCAYLRLSINLASDGGAKTIISGDSHLLKLKEYKGIKIIKVADFLRTK
jgi:predicted nucleic acid-binding protein